MTCSAAGPRNCGPAKSLHVVDDAGSLVLIRRGGGRIAYRLCKRDVKNRQPSCSSANIRARGRQIVLVLDLADNFFNDIFERNNP